MLAILRKPATAEEVSETLEGMGVKEISPAFVQDEIAELQKVRLLDGTIVSLVAQGTDGKWGAAGV